MKTSHFTLVSTLVCIMLLSFSTQALSQDSWYGAFTYQVSFPTGDSKDFTSPVSFRGVGLDYRTFVQSNTTAGFFLGWNVFHERTTETFSTQNIAVWGTQDRYINAFPIMANVHYYLGQKGEPRPYIGLNAGGFVVLQRFAVGIVSLSNDTWEWGLAPEAGVIARIDRDHAVIINGKFNWAFNGETYGNKDFNLTYFGLNVGFVWQE